MIFRIIVLLMLASCTSAPDHKEMISNFSESHPSCVLKIDDFKLPIPRTAEQQLTRGVKTTGSVMFTTVGFVTDVVVVGFGVLGLNWLCGDDFEQECIDIVFSAYPGIGPMTYEKTYSWRCPYVDHISRKIRKSAMCNYEREHFIEAFEQMNFLQTNEVMKRCSTESEKEEFKQQMKRMHRRI